MANTGNPPPIPDTASTINVDWDLVRREYETGQYTVRALADRHGISSHSTIVRRAQTGQWTQAQTSRVAARARAREQQQAILSAVKSGLISHAPTTVEEAIDAAAAVQVELVRLHKMMLSDAAAKAAEIMRALKGKTVTKSRIKEITQDLDAWMRVASKLIPLERQAHGLDTEGDAAAGDQMPLQDRLGQYRRPMPADDLPATRSSDMGPRGCREPGDEAPKPVITSGYRPTTSDTQSDVGGKSVN